MMECYLAEHPELKLSQECLFDGKYLKLDYYVHHINFDRLDNRLENFWICDLISYKEIEGSVFSLIDDLLKSKLLIFEKGKYYLNY